MRTSDGGRKTADNQENKYWNNNIKNDITSSRNIFGNLSENVASSDVKNRNPSDQYKLIKLHLLSEPNEFGYVDKHHWQRFLAPCQFEIVNPGILISSTVRSRQWTLQAFGFHLSTSWQCNAVSKLTEEAKWHRSLWRQAVLYTSRRRCRDKFSLEFLLIWPPNGKISIRWYLSLSMFNSILFSIFFSFAQNIMCIKFEWFYNII